MKFKTSLFWVFLLAISFGSCKKWDDHTTLVNQDLSKNLQQEISERANLSKFTEYLQKTGLDKELASSKSYTVWAPTNDALQSLDPAIVADPARLKQFVANHISLQTYFTSGAQTAVRVPMLNGKRETFLNTKFEDANIIEADKYVGNGVLHLIDKYALAYPNAWELVNSTKTNFQQNAFLLSLTRNVFDLTNAIVDSISAITGRPVYRPGTDSVLRNSFNAQVFDLASEEKQYTYFILNDAGFNTEINKLSPYYIAGTVDSTRNLAANAVVKDLVVEGMYTIDQLPPVLTTKFGVKIPIDKSKIVETRRISNGVAYVFSAINFDKKDKIPTVIVQGESYRGFFRDSANLFAPVSPTQNLVSAIFRRVRNSKITGLPYNDIFVYGHGISGLNVQYQVLNTPSVKYKVYWVAVSDTFTIYQTAVNAPVFKQRLLIGTRTTVGPTALPYITLTQNNYAEVFVGDYVQPKYGTLDMFLTSDISTAAPANSLTLDYIKLVPDL